MLLDPLIAALRDTGTPVCLAEADRLHAAVPTGPGMRLHLRRAGLMPTDAARIAAALTALPDATRAALGSVSFSYNAQMGDPGAVALIGALPVTAQELGMVGCGLTDASGEALVTWLHGAQALRIVCVEDNAFSAPMRARIRGVFAGRSGLAVV
jgi:hypothetical protein